MANKNPHTRGLLCRAALAALLACLLPLSAAAAGPDSQTDYSDYVNILYNSENGMPTSESNDIVQSPDGFIWIASYSGLVRYDGRSFERMSGKGGVSSANTVFIDSAERLWIGTNDNGVILYQNGEYTVYNKAAGLGSNSVRAIEQDSAGNLYVGTAAGAAVITPAGAVQPLAADTLGDAYISAMEMLADDTLLCVTNTSRVYTVQGGAAKELLWNGIEKMNGVLSAYAVPGENRWFLGTESGTILECTGTPEDFSVREIDCGGLSAVNEIQYISDGTLWVCTDSGVGYFDPDGTLHIMSDFAINNSVDNMIEDSEGNLWFSSSRQGVFKCTRNYFVDLGKKAGLGEMVVNSITGYNGLVYAGADTGLVALNGAEPVQNALTELLSGVRVRNLMVDSQNRLWLSSYGATGLVCYDGKTITTLSEAEGIASSKVRSAIETADGSIYAATANGIYVVRDLRVVGRIGTAEGLTNPEVLSLCQANGKLYAGTDGGGVCVIENGQVTDCINADGGMQSDIVMRVRLEQKTGALWFVTSNSLACYQNGQVLNIDKFPYSNNYDLYFGNDDSVWVLSSNGLYVTTRSSLLNAAPLVYTFYDYNCGMPSTPTSNSFSWVDQENELLYICGSGGIFNISMNRNEAAADAAVKLAIPDVLADGETFWVGGDAVRLPADIKRLTVDAYVLSYGLQNPLIEYYMDGFDEEKTVVRKSEFQGVAYTNLSGGDYLFHLAVLDPATQTVLSEKTLSIQKQKRLSENAAFPVLVALLLIGLAAGGSYMVLRLAMNRRLMEKEEAQKQILTDALAAAQSASEAKGQFLSRVSHEIRTPLNAVIGYMDIAGHSANDPEKVQHCVQNSSIAAKHLLSIINDVLDMSSIESGKMKIAHEEFDLRSQITSVSTLFFNQAKAQGVQFDVQLKNITEEWVVGDGLRLSQVLVNLLSNAVKFTPKGGKITLTITQQRCDAKQVFFRFDIADTGIGMSKEYQQRLFKPFEQESAATAQKYGGTGLGLSITNNLVNMMGGSIEVDSIQGRGTTFGVSLFFDRSAAEHGQAEKTADYSKIRVLIVDDDGDSRMQIQETLRRCHVKSDAVSDGEAALRQLKRRLGTDYQYDMCILDWNMPGMNGIQVAERIRRECDSTMPIIIATAYDVTDCATPAKAAGVNRVIAKPLFQSTILDLLVSTYGKYEPSGESAPKVDLTGLHVLLAEDNDMNMEIAVDILQKAGVAVEQAENGSVALKKFVASRPGGFDAILMDVQMPVMDGYEATAKIRASTHPQAKTIPIIAMTANAFAEDVQQALANGMNSHIAKPIDQGKLFAVLGSVRDQK